MTVRYAHDPQTGRILRTDDAYPDTPPRPCNLKEVRRRTRKRAARMGSATSETDPAWDEGAPTGNTQRNGRRSAEAVIRRAAKKAAFTATTETYPHV